MSAARCGHEAVVRYLIQKGGVDVNAVDSERVVEYGHHAKCTLCCYGNIYGRPDWVDSAILGVGMACLAGSSLPSSNCGVFGGAGADLNAKDAVSSLTPNENNGLLQDGEMA